MVLLFVLFVAFLTASVSPIFAQLPAPNPPPTPCFMLTSPSTNKISYVSNVANQGGENSQDIVLDFAIPKTSAPDFYIEMKGVTVTGGSNTLQESYLDRENARLRILTSAIRPNEQLTVNITFLSLKYKVEYPRPLLSGAGYPPDYAIYTQPEQYIESNDPLIVSKAQSLIGTRVDTFRIAQRMYDFVISYLSYVKQSETRGALWALQNGKGDCTEFGMLFVALLRAVGIPARTVSGFVSSGFSVPPPPPLGAAASSSHLWAEFYVEGIGWVPVDPTFGRSTPEDHFAILWSRYMPFLKGPTMKSPEHSLISLRYTGSFLNYTAQLYVTQIESLDFTDQTVSNLFQTESLCDTMRIVADRAYGYDFNIAESYLTMENAYQSLFSATNAINKGDLATANMELDTASIAARNALDTITGITESGAREAVNRAWSSGRFLGAIGGESYLQRAAGARLGSDYVGIVKYSQYAKKAADTAPSIFFLLGPLALCIFTVWSIRRTNGNKNHVNPKNPT